MGSSPSKNVDIRADLPKEPIDALEDDGSITCPLCQQVLEDPHQPPTCRHSACRACFLRTAATEAAAAGGVECRLCGEVTFPADGASPEDLTPDEEARRRVDRWRRVASATPNILTSKQKAPADASSSTREPNGDDHDDDSDVVVIVSGSSGAEASLDDETVAMLRRFELLAGEDRILDAEQILERNRELLRRQLDCWAEDGARLDAFVEDCHRVIDEEADALRRRLRERRLRAQQQTVEQRDLLHKLRLGAAKLRAAVGARSPEAAKRAAAGHQARLDAARNGALAWLDSADKDKYKDDKDIEPLLRTHLRRLRELAADSLAPLLAPASRLRPSPVAAQLAGGTQGGLAAAASVFRRQQRRTGAIPTRELHGVHVWDLALVRHDGSLCYRPDGAGGGGGVGGGDSGADGDSVGGVGGGVCRRQATSKWRPLPNPTLYCLLPAAARLRLLSPATGAVLTDLRLSRQPKRNLERIRWHGDRLYLSEPECVFVADLTGACLHVLAGFSWAMGLWPDPERRRLLVVNGDRRCVDIFCLETFSHDGSLCDPEFTDDLTGVCVSGGRILVADHTAFRLHAYDAANLESLGRFPVSAPRFLDVDAAGLIYVTGDETDYHQVTVLEPSGGALRFSVGFEGSKAGQFRSPSGLAVDDVAGELYVCDFDNERVQVFTLTTA